MEIASVEEVGGDALRFQLEATEFENFTVDGGLQEVELVLWKSCGRHFEMVVVLSSGDRGEWRGPISCSKGK